MWKLSRTALLGLAAVVSACSLTPDYQRPEVPLPEQWSATPATLSPATPAAGVQAAGAQVIGIPAAEAPAVAVDAQWWRHYHSEELEQLMVEALAANHDLAAAVARIEQARASVQVARSVLLPSVNAGAQVSRSRQRVSGDSALGSDSQASVSASYELDVFGGNRAGWHAAQATLQAQQYTRDSVALTLQADVATDYFTVLALRQRLAIAEQNRVAAQQLLDLMQIRFDAGYATALDVAQQRTTLLSFTAQIPALQQSERETLDALAVLLGRVPQGFTVKAQQLDAVNLPVIDAGMPATVLTQRPDLRAAEASLIAANANIGAARAALFPQVDLSASAAVTGVLTAGQGSLASLAASLTQVLFDGGQRRAQVALSQAQREELAQTYVQTALTALQEVGDSLSAVETQARREQLLAATAAQAGEAYRLARARFDAGQDDGLTLLDSERTQLSAQDTQVQAQLARYTASVSLFKALGGGAIDATSTVALP